MATDASRPKITRVVSARHYFEMSGQKSSNEYQLLSSLIHNRVPPTNEEGNVLTDREKIEGEIKLCEFMGNTFEYQNYYNEITDTSSMKMFYKKTDASKYDKLCITRCLLQKKNGKDIRDNVLWNFLCEAYHIEKDSIYSIGNMELFDVPDYIIKMCDSIIDEL